MDMDTQENTGAPAPESAVPQAPADTAPTGADTPEAPGERHDTLLGNRQEDAQREATGQHFALVRSQVEQEQRAQWAGMVREWRTALEHDAELGGMHLEHNVAKAQLALNRFDPDGVVSTWLGTSGYGNHPDVLRFLLRIADAMSEDTITGGASGTGRRASLEERMYGNWQP